MPFVRCKFYSESGEPLKGGCRKGAGCAFVHPGDSRWTTAPSPSSRVGDRSSDSGVSKPWGDRDKRILSAWDTSGNASTSTAGAGGGWDSGGAREGWGTGGGWGTGAGWDMSGPPSTGNQVPEPTATPTASEGGWGGSGWGESMDADKAGGSGWGSNGNGGWGASSWGENTDTNKAGGSGWGTSWEEKKDTGKNSGSSWGNTQNDGWGTGWGDGKDSTNTWGASDSMTVDSQVGKGHNKGKGRAVPPPPRIRIPDNSNKKAKITGTNNEPLGSSKRGESRSSDLRTTSTPVTVSTPVATLTPTELPRAKRKRDVAVDDKLDTFKEYIKTWERGVRARFLLAEAEAKRDRWFRTQKSVCYARIGEAGRKRLDGQRAECDKEVNLQREKLSGAITSLVDFHDKISSSLDLGQRYNIGEEAKKFIIESRAFVDEVRAILVEHVLKDRNGIQQSDAQQHHSGADANSMDTLRSQVRDLEERFDQAQTELTLRHRRDIRSEINELLAAKVAGLRVARQHEIDRVSSQPRPEIVISPGALKTIEATTQQARALDAKIPHAVEDIRLLLLRVDATTKRVSELEEELSINKEAYRKQIQEMAAEKEKTERKVDERLDMIREQYQQLVASQPCGPTAEPTVTSSTYNSQDKLMESLRPAFEVFLDKFYEREVRPTVASLQQLVIEASDRHQEEAIKVLWGKIQPAMNMVAGVSRWLDSQELGSTAPDDL